MTSLSDLFSSLSTGLSRAAAQPSYLNFAPANEMQRTFVKSHAVIKLLVGGNRAGKTISGLAEDVGWATKRHKWRPEVRNYPHPIRGRIVVKDVQTIKERLAELRYLIPQSDLINGSWEDSWSAGDKILTFANASTIDFKTYEQDVESHAGSSRHFVHMDEPPPAEIYKENKLRVLDTRGDFLGSGAIWITYTPTNGIDWAHRDLYTPGVKDPENSGILVLHMSLDENPYISQKDKDDLFKGMSQADIDIRRYGKYIQLSGMVFDEWGPAHIIRPDELSELWGETLLPPSYWQLGWSIDHGVNNPTAIYWHAANPQTDEIITFHERYLSKALVADHAAYVHKYERENTLTGRPIYRTGDPAMRQTNGASGTSIIQEYSMRGIGIATESVPKDPSIGITRMRQYMTVNPKTGKPYWRIYDCPYLYEELTQLHWEKYASTKIASGKNAKETVHKYKDHGFDSVKYYFTSRPALAPQTGSKTGASKPPPGSYLAAMMDVESPPPPVHIPWDPSAVRGGFIPRAVTDPATSWEIYDNDYSI